MEWQAIETAPRDGTLLLIWGTRGNMIAPDQTMLTGRYDRGWWTQQQTISHATHWAHLPNPPLEDR